jgi:WhiB family transcriptional regulator, redox-sensing transcriptional regulator
MGELEVLWLMMPDAPDVTELVAGPINRPAWHRRAECRGVGTEMFFPEPGETTDAAAAVGEGCEVPAECLFAAQEHGAKGVWGGLSRRQRRDLRPRAA